MANENFVKSVYPLAQCKQVISEKTGLRFEIVVRNKCLAVSWTSEDTAWGHARSILNNKLIGKLTN